MADDLQAVAWRGDALPLDAAGLVDLLRGARSAAPLAAREASTC